MRAGIANQAASIGITELVGAAADAAASRSFGTIDPAIAIFTNVAGITAGREFESIVVAQRLGFVAYSQTSIDPAA